MPAAAGCAIREIHSENGGKLWFSAGTKVKPQPDAAMVDLSFLDKAKARFG